MVSRGQLSVASVALQPGMPEKMLLVFTDVVVLLINEGYVDHQAREDVNDRLTWHGHVDASEVEPDANDGVVTLTGSVESRYEKRLAEDIAESVSGVWDVHNQLSIRRRGRSNGEMTGRQIRPGMEVIGKDGEQVGEVKEVRSNDFLVDRSLARDVYVPFNACQKADADGRIRLNVRADEVDAQDWEIPDLFETGSPQKSQSKRYLLRHDEAGRPSQRSIGCVMRECTPNK